jgi:cell division protein FtsB
VKLRLRRRTPEPQALRRLHALDGGRAAEAKAASDEERAPKPPKEHPHRRRRILAAVWTSAVVAAAGLLLLLVLPTRAWLAQRSAIASAQHKLDIVQSENAKLQSRLQALQTPEDIEQVAREQYNLAAPGEKVFSVLPAPALTNLPSGWPFSLVNEIVTVRAAAAAPSPGPTAAAPSPGPTSAPSPDPATATTTVPAAPTASASPPSSTG